MNPATLRAEILRWITLIMVSVLFLVWFVFGSATINKQNLDILQGVHQEVIAIEKQAEKNYEQLKMQTNYLTCILLIDPANRTTRKVHRCRTRAGF